MTICQDYSCSRYDHAYPYLINNDPRLGDPEERTFEFKSCSGVLAMDILDEQIPALDSGQQAILLSVAKAHVPHRTHVWEHYHVI